MATGLDSDASYSPLAISPDAGATWSVTTFPSWAFLGACSASGQSMIMGVFSGVYVSQDFGATWRLTGLPTYQWWRCVASSADGAKLIAAASDSRLGAPNSIHSSADTGSTWTVDDAPNTNWISIASSADGCSALAAVGEPRGFIYRSQSTPQPVLRTRLTDNQLVLAWTIPSTPFVLQQAASLASSNWNEVLVTPVLNTSTLENEVVIGLETANRFYRLIGVVD
jgi:hypothetical protein